MLFGVKFNFCSNSKYFEHEKINDLANAFFRTLDQSVYEMFQENNVKNNTNNTSIPLRDLNIADLRNLVATFPNFKTLITPPSNLSLEHLNK